VPPPIFERVAMHTSAGAPVSGDGYMWNA